MFITFKHMITYQWPKSSKEGRKEGRKEEIERERERASL